MVDAYKQTNRQTKKERNERTNKKRKKEYYYQLVDSRGQQIVIRSPRDLGTIV